MKTFNSFLPLVALVLGVALPASAATIIHEAFESGYDRVNNNIAGGNLAVYKSRTSTTAATVIGALSYSAAAASVGSDQYFGYFTDPGANVGSSVQNGHVVLGVGQTLSVSLKFNLQSMPAATTYGLRFGLFDDAGTRQAADLGSGGSSAAFANNPGYALFVPLTSATGLTNQMSIRSRTNLNVNNVFSAGADFMQIGSTVGGAYTPLASGTDYVLKFDISLQDASTTLLSAAITDSTGATTMTSGSVANTGAQLTSFNWLAWRPPQQPDSANGGTITFSDINVQVTAAVPEPSALALVGVAVLGLGFLGRRMARR